MALRYLKWWHAGGVINGDGTGHAIDGALVFNTDTRELFLVYDGPGNTRSETLIGWLPYNLTQAERTLRGLPHA